MLSSSPEANHLDPTCPTPALIRAPSHELLPLDESFDANTEPATLAQSPSARIKP